jgi:hypothetical protein
MRRYSVKAETDIKRDQIAVPLKWKDEERCLFSEKY